MEAHNPAPRNPATCSFLRPVSQSPAASASNGAKTRPSQRANGFLECPQRPGHSVLARLATNN